MPSACRKRCNAQEPYTWQLDAAEAFSLALDCSGGRNRCRENPAVHIPFV
ncbi:hypothetical protein BKA82DRAFT_967390 [Pisolithus tinctorius]|uniref:Uncharacterized protein n=1 Tax=Pisolithus tinctorius Marx 270 TaxID=870435 RepID=A0A0C3JPX4_PISTI|nr:hypothetical protein BKA82DRAFT_967390 [Pisolithus tinctorius]KIO11238.1 hypothetical protein M404DRAFT_967390 [Pisolithus tinctorius Marx 270]